jgi:predicted chitinase
MAQPYTVTRDGKLYVRLRYFADGKWKAKERQVANAREAVSVLAEMKAELAQFGVDAYDSERMTFDQMVVEYRRAKPDMADYLFEPLDYFRGRRARSISYADLVMFAQHRKQVPNRAWIAHEARKARMTNAGKKVSDRPVIRSSAKQQLFTVSLSCCAASCCTRCDTAGCCAIHSRPGPR